MKKLISHRSKYEVPSKLFFIADCIPIDVWNEPLNVKMQNSTFLNFICRRDIFVLQMQCIKNWMDKI